MPSVGMPSVPFQQPYSCHWKCSKSTKVPASPAHFQTIQPRSPLSPSPAMSRAYFLNLISNSSNPHHINQIHAQVILYGLHNDVIAVTKLTQKLSDFGLIQQARLLVSTISRPDLFLFNVLLRGFSHNNSPSSALSLYTHLRLTTSLKPDNFTYAFVISSASLLSFDKWGKILHAHSILDGFESDMFVGSAVMDFYLKFKQQWVARKVFDKILKPDTVSWNTMISGLVKNCCFEESIEVFDEMGRSGNQFDSSTLAVILPAMAELQELKMGKKIQCLAMKSGFHEHGFVLTGMVSLYSKCRDIVTARVLFERIRKPDLISWNAMISGYSSNGQIECAVKLFRKLLASVEKVNSSTIVGLIPVFSPFGNLHLSRSIHGFSIKCGVDLNTSVSTALTTVYSRLNEIELAKQLFDEAPEKSLESWNAMISGYTQNGLTEMAISLFQQMQMQEVTPNPVTVTSILSACAQLGALSLGKWVHKLIDRENFQANIYVSTALIDMYAKCGSINRAQHVFDGMIEKNVVSWNAMISGYGLHGLGRESLRLYNEMLHEGISPSGVTFLSVLYACSHAGLVAEGEKVFESMPLHGIEPGPEHYACMVDILGRAGKLEKALKFITEMPVEPGAAEWGALLGACMIHKNTNLAQVASDNLFRLDADNVGYHVLLSNIYSSDQNYPAAAVVRQAVRKKKLAKTPGCTLIELGETLHVFTSGDRSHPQSMGIYAMLEKLTAKMREAGFRSETEMALHDVEEEEKEQMVNVHSEKLAIAFGLINTEPGTEIRIIKNLRVCLDCHNATKFISKITEREIVVRDANRFHHFKDGICSCGDYW